MDKPLHQSNKETEKNGSIKSVSTRKLLKLIKNETLWFIYNKPEYEMLKATLSEEDFESGNWFKS